MNPRLTIAAILLVFFPGVGYGIFDLSDIPYVAKMYSLLGYVTLMGYLLATGFKLLDSPQHTPPET